MHPSWSVSYHLRVTLARINMPMTYHYFRYNYFEEEEVDLNEWVTSWLQYLLAKELTFDNLVRLWGKTLTPWFFRIGTKDWYEYRYVFFVSWSYGPPSICLPRYVDTFFCVCLPPKLIPSTAQPFCVRPRKTWKTWSNLRFAPCWWDYQIWTSLE